MIYKKCPHLRACHKTCNHNFRQKVQLAIRSIGLIDFLLRKQVAIGMQIRLGEGGVSLLLF